MITVLDWQAKIQLCLRIGQWKGSQGYLRCCQLICQVLSSLIRLLQRKAHLPHLGQKLLSILYKILCLHGCLLCQQVQSPYAKHASCTAIESALQGRRHIALITSIRVESSTPVQQHSVPSPVSLFCRLWPAARSQPPGLPCQHHPAAASAAASPPLAS